jgi:hypothetical protein
MPPRPPSSHKPSNSAPPHLSPPLHQLILRHHGCLVSYHTPVSPHRTTLPSPSSKRGGDLGGGAALSLPKASLTFVCEDGLDSCRLISWVQCAQAYNIGPKA